MLVCRHTSIGQAFNELEMIVQTTEQDEWVNRVEVHPTLIHVPRKRVQLSDVEEKCLGAKVPRGKLLVVASFHFLACNACIARQCMSLHCNAGCPRYLQRCNDGMYRAGWGRI